MLPERIITAQVQAITYKKPDLTTEDQEAILLAEELGFDITSLINPNIAKYKV